MALIGCPVDSLSPPASSEPVLQHPRPANRIITNRLLPLPRVHATRPPLGAATWTQPPLQQCTRGHSMTWRLPRGLVHSATPPAMHTCTFRDLALPRGLGHPSSITRGDSMTWRLPRGLVDPPAGRPPFQPAHVALLPSLYTWEHATCARPAFQQYTCARPAFQQYTCAQPAASSTRGLSQPPAVHVDSASNAHVYLP